MNLYVIDDATRLPIQGASVQVGTVSGTTDATGFFEADGVTGAQTIAIAAAGYRSELWLGANGANVTGDLKAAIDPTPDQATLAGSIAGFDAVTVPTGHHKAALVGYSQDDKATDAANNLQTPGGANICDTALPTGTCSFSVVTRTGHLALYAAILDHDLNGTPTNPSDDKFTIIGWATLTGVVAQNGVNQTGLALTMVSAANLGNATIDFGSPPSSLPNVAAVLGIELGTDGNIILSPEFASPSGPNLPLVPKLSAFTSATYRLLGVANNGSTSTAAQSVVLQRGLSGGPFTAGAWIAPPSQVSLSRAGGSWAAVSGALVTGATYDTDPTHHLLSVTAFDGSTSFTLPSSLALPTTGSMIATGTALQGTLDLTNFSIDADFSKVTGFSSQPTTIN